MAITNNTPASKQSNEDFPALTGHDLIDKAEDVALHWWGTLECLMEQAAYGHGRETPLPQWAIDWLEHRASYKQFREQYDQHRQFLKMARQSINLAEGSGIDFAYEIWTERLGHRVEVRHESLESANEALAKVKMKYPDAFVARVSLKDAIVGNDDPALLDTLIGRLWWAGTWMGRDDEEDHFTIIDTTGRSVTLPASVMVKHQGIMSRLSDEAKDRIESDLKMKERKRAIRVAAAEANHG